MTRNSACLNMGTRYQIAVSRRIDAPASTVYSILADYVDWHPRILPKAFSGLSVERGGIGDGTVIAFSMRSFGRTFHSRAGIRETEPGRVLVETLLDGSGIVTTFTVDPLDTRCNVTVSSEIPLRRGLAGPVERFLLTRHLSKVYREELDNLDKVAKESYFLSGTVQK